ncbi:transmembrane exosortase EpsH [mine drainage metagenome]|uniref:Transmembrane exosortase EpsH n=1 Tax=mine drainage metagenome TaxID=410659 RepID=A0A1J5SSX5_9ZZZZ
MSSTAPAPRQRAESDYKESWHTALSALLFALLWLLVCYWNTAASMVAIWVRSETFAHGFVVPLISLWLIWRERVQLAALAPRPAGWALLPLAAAGLAWLLGDLANVNSLSQLALVAMLILVVPAVLGTQVSRVIVFPLCFLFFAVPIGEFMLPQLMAWTADFTVFALRLTGIPVYREGQNFSIPSGNWSVVEACSGVRYLIASVMVGTLYAYLNYRSLLRRLVFVAVAFLVPITANWFRAYLIVLIGHLSGNRLATGVDHLIYGWLFFGMVMATMFWIGARWREDGCAKTNHPLGLVQPAGPSLPAASVWLAVAAIAATTVAWRLGDWAIERSAAAHPPRFANLAPIVGWQPMPDSVSDWRPQYHGPSFEVLRNYRRGSARVGLYLGYYRNQSYARKLVSSVNVLADSRDQRWSVVNPGSLEVLRDDQPFAVKTAELRGAAGERLLVWRWYWVGGRFTASDGWAKGYTAFSRMLGRGDDAAVVILFTPKGKQGEAPATLAEFLAAATPALNSALSRTRDAR